MAFVAYGKYAVATAGTPVQIVPPAITNANPNYNQYVVEITIQYPTGGGTGNLYVGDSTLNKSNGTGVAAALAVGQSITIPCNVGTLHPLNVYIDGDTNGNFCYVSAVTK